MTTPVITHKDGWDSDFALRRARVDLFEVTFEGREYRARCSASWDEPTYSEWRLEHLSRLTLSRYGRETWTRVSPRQAAWHAIETLLINHRREHGYAPRPQPEKA